MQVLFGLVGAGIGSLVGNPALGWSIGTLVGGALFNEAEGFTNESGRIGDQRIQGATQGTPIAIVYGRERVAGNIMWAAGITETESSESTGGKKGGATIVTVTNTTSFAVLLARGNPTDRDDLLLRRIWANNEVVWSHRPELGESSPVVSEKLQGAGITFYPGDESQAADPTIQADKGADNTPAFLGRSYVVFDTLVLNKIGNTIPNFAFEIDSGAWTVEEVLLDIWEMCGGDVADCDFSDVAGITVEGFVIPAKTEARAAMAALGEMYSFDIVEYDGLLRTVLRGGSSSYTIDYEELGATAGESEQILKVAVSRTQEVELPVSETVFYHSQQADFQQFSQRADILGKSSDEEGSISFQAVITDAEARTLAEIRLRSKWAERDRVSFVTTYRMLKMVPGDIVTLELAANGAITKTVKIVRVEGVAPGLIEVEAWSYDPDVYTQDVTAATIDSDPGEVFNPGTTYYVVTECNAPNDSIASRDETLLVCAAGRLDGGWMGGWLFSSDQKGKYTDPDPNGFGPTVHAYFAQRATFGVADGALPSGDYHSVDDVNTLTVVLQSGPGLYSITRDQLLQGQNLALLGRELICFQTATEVAANTYELTGLRRGLRGTEQEVDEHIDGDVFILLNGREKWFGYYPVNIGDTIDYYFQDTGSGTNLADVTTPTLVGLSRRPYSPVLLSGTRSAGVSVALAWTRRARINADLVPYGDAPLDETSEVYTVEIYSYDGVTLKRTETITGATTFLYTLAMQVADFGAESAFSFRVAQYTEVCSIGNGEFSELLQVAGP